MTKAEQRALKAYPDQSHDLLHTPSWRYERNIYVKGYEQAEKDLGWHSVEESLPKIDEEVVVLRDEHGTAPIYKVGVGHIVDRRYAMDFNGWNTPGVKFWMRFPKIPEE